MADGIYTAMSGAVARATQLDSIADNLANVSTTGFKAQRPAFESFLPPGETSGPAAPAAVATDIDLKEGPRQTTGEPLDATPEGGAFFAVSLDGNQIGYTRNGQMSVKSDDGNNGILMTAGHPVLDVDGNAIVVPPGQKVDVAADGSVSVQGTQLAQLGTYLLSGHIERVSSSVLGLGTSGAALPANGRVHVGELELGNYTPMEGVVQMIEANRAYDSAMQAIQTYKSMGSRANQLGVVQQS